MALLKASFRESHLKVLSAYNTIDNTSLLKVFSTFSQTSLIDLINGSIGRISGSLPISFIRSISFFHYLKQNMGVCLLGTFLFKLLTFVLLMFLVCGFAFRLLLLFLLEAICPLGDLCLWFFF